MADTELWAWGATWVGAGSTGLTVEGTTRLTALGSRSHGPAPAGEEESLALKR